MDFSVFGTRTKRRDQIVVFDLGTRTTKAVLLRSKGSRFVLANFALHDAPPATPGKSPASEALVEHLKKVYQSLETSTKQIVLVIGVNDSILRQAEMPMVPVSDLRVMLKLNPKTYLQQELTDYIFDCFLLANKTVKSSGEAGKTPATPKCKVIVGGTRRQFLEELVQVVKNAGLLAEYIVPNLLGPPNALELAQPEVFENEVVAVVDLGFKHSTISILQAGELMLNRVVSLGGDKLTSGLADSMGISYDEAEGIKVGMPQEVESNLAPLLTPLGRELRASIDFFEHQHDKTVSQIFLCGGAARSEFIMQAMENELMAPCKSWNPIGHLEMDLPLGKAAELEPLHCQFAVAAGAAATAY